MFLTPRALNQWVDSYQSVLASLSVEKSVPEVLGALALFCEALVISKAFWPFLGLLDPFGDFFIFSTSRLLLGKSKFREFGKRRCLVSQNLPQRH